MRRLFYASAALAVGLIIMLGTARWIKARAVLPVQPTDAKVTLLPDQQPPVPPVPPAPPAGFKAGWSPTLSFPQVTDGRTYVCPEPGKLDVAAVCDLGHQAGTPPLRVVWRLEVSRHVGQCIQTLWEQTYRDQPFQSNAGVHTAPTFEEALQMPAGHYLVRVSLVDANGGAGDVHKSFWADVR
jgi:hypothetical protein